MVGTAAIAWRQYQELLTLRAQTAGEDRADLQKRLAEAQKRLQLLEDQLAGQRPPAAGQITVNADTLGQAGANPQFRPTIRSALQAVTGSPEYQKLWAEEQKAQLDSRYGALFKSLTQGLNLTPEQLDQFKNLLVQKQQTMLDALAAARQEGVSPRGDPAGFQQAMTDAQAPLDQQIQSTLGSAGFSQYQQYNQTLPQHTTVNQVSQALSYSPTPLTDQQASQLTALLAQDQPAAKTAPGTVNFGSLLGNTTPAPITDEAVSAAQSFLSPPQIQALQQIQQAQQAQGKMQDLLRASEQAARSTPGGSN